MSEPPIEYIKQNAIQQMVEMLLKLSTGEMPRSAAIGNIAKVICDFDVRIAALEAIAKAKGD